MPVDSISISIPLSSISGCTAFFSILSSFVFALRYVVTIFSLFTRDRSRSSCFFAQVGAPGCMQRQWMIRGIVRDSSDRVGLVTENDSF